MLSDETVDLNLRRRHVMTLGSQTATRPSSYSQPSCRYRKKTVKPEALSNHNRLWVGDSIDSHSNRIEWHTTLVNSDMFASSPVAFNSLVDFSSQDQRKTPEVRTRRVQRPLPSAGRGLQSRQWPVGLGFASLLLSSRPGAQSIAQQMTTRPRQPGQTWNWKSIMAFHRQQIASFKYMIHEFTK